MPNFTDLSFVTATIPACRLIDKMIMVSKYCIIKMQISMDTQYRIGH